MSNNESMSVFEFPGGVTLPSNKTAQTAAPISQLPVPARVWIPLRQHRGAPAIACVEVGQQMRTGDLIGKANGVLSANVHASISGQVESIETHKIAHPSGLEDLCICIAAGTTQHDNDAHIISHDYHLEDPNVLRLKVAEAGIVGMGGAVFPTALKLAAEADRKLHTLILNGAECEPYISCDDMLLREHAAAVLSGAQMMLHILQINNAWIAVESDKTAAINALRETLTQLNDDRITLKIVPSIYPEGGERQLIQVLSGKEVPTNGLPVDIGFLCHNVGTAYAVYNAFTHGHALTSRIVTVAGNGVVKPQNLIVPFGTLIKDIIQYCGGYTQGPQRLIIGGPMMGFSIESDETPIDKATNCILVLPEIESRQQKPVMPCIRCGDCAQACPASLLPQQLFAYAGGNKLDDLKRLHIFDCIECGCCDYVCPSNIPLTESFRYAKDELWNRDAQLTRAELARTRFEHREVRLAKEQETRSNARVLRKQKQHDTQERKTEIQEAVARAKARKQSPDSNRSS